ncbi:hypothetical protein FZZ93_16255, partial [Halomonas eurihalina]
RATSYELRATSYELRATSYELRATSQQYKSGFASRISSQSSSRYRSASKAAMQPLPAEVTAWR